MLLQKIVPINILVLSAAGTTPLEATGSAVIQERKKFESVSASLPLTLLALRDDPVFLSHVALHDPVTHDEIP